MKAQHEMTPDGESTARWACNQPGFWGSIKQITHCARCGEVPPPRRRDEPFRTAGFGTPTFHMLCNQCWAELPR